MSTFRAILVDEFNQPPRLASLETTALSAGNVTVAVQYSGLNYKDALALTSRGKIIRRFPFVPGIDCAGLVETSDDPQFAPGQAVLLTGWGVGERHWGGLAEKVRVSGDWLLPLPDGLTAHQAMSLGTAGLTAALAVMRLEEHGMAPAKGPVLVIGASGGVGSVAVMLLAQRGWRVTAVTGREQHSAWLHSLGAQAVLSRAELLANPRPLASELWSGAVDVAGGATLAAVLSQLSYDAPIAVVGLADDAQFAASVFPFILRNVALYGVDSVMCPAGRRQRAWALLAHHLDAAQLAAVTTTIPLEQVPAAAAGLLDGEVRGRLVVAVGE